MWSFLVLGIIPGTNLQLNFWGWLEIAILIGLVGFIFKAIVKRHWPNLLRPSHVRVKNNS